MRLWYEPHLERIHEDAQIRRNDIMQLEQIAAGYASRERFLTELTLDPPDATSDEAGPPYLDEDYLILSTIHSAKGQEWKSVFVLNGIDGCIPSDLGVGTSEEIEEERRLLYVAMTRAKDELDILVPQRCYVLQQRRGGDRHLFAQRTRFIPEAILPYFRASLWPPAGRERAAGKGRGPTHRRRRAPQAALGLTDGAATPNFCLMRAFAALLDRLVLTPQRSVKLRLMTDYFRATPDPDRGFALAALTGELDIPSVKPAMLRAMVTARVDEVLFAYSYDYVGDLAETIALIWPARGRA